MKNPVHLCLLNIALLLITLPQNSSAEERLDYPLLSVEKSQFPIRIKDFEYSAKLNGVTINIQHCEDIYYMTAGENFSYVASCSLIPKRSPVMLCNDRMSGHFALTVTFENSPKEMEAFLNRHCTGG
ncbi:MAG: hypothetical protein AAAB16_13515 [Pseudomonas sp.]|uniref:hypothetical protein n=1 Tax=Pseudomonas sp. TaxID=306 RepID=UPI0030F181A9